MCTAAGDSVVCLTLDDSVVTAADDSVVIAADDSVGTCPPLNNSRTSMVTI